MAKRAFTTADIATLCHHSRGTVKRWLEKGNLKGYRVGTAGHWRVLPGDLALFLKENDIPFPDPVEIGLDLKALSEIESVPTFCWEFYRDNMDAHVRPGEGCEQCLVHKVRSINCYALREEVGHKKIHCNHSCEQCDYFRLQRQELLPKV